MEIRKIKVGGVNTTYASFGTNTQPKILMLHGFRGNHKGLRDVAEKIRGFQVIIPDLPGYGGTEKLESANSFVSYASFINDFCTELDIGNFNLAGHSFGATLGIVYAGLFPKQIKSLTLIAPVLNAASFQASIGKLYYNIASHLPTSIKKLWVKNRTIDILSNLVLFKSSPYKRRVKLIMDGQRNIKTLNEDVVMENFLGYYSTNIWSLAQTINIPTLIMTGSKDRLATPESIELLSKGIRNSKKIILSGEGHIVQLENPQAVAKELENFLEGI